ncbi:MAG: hypothetical protein R3A48_19295 [Polyangiales bacterium]
MDDDRGGRVAARTSSPIGGEVRMAWWIRISAHACTPIAPDLALDLALQGECLTPRSLE